jgi:hypothetical protein
VPFWEDVLNEVKNGSPKALGKVPTEEVGECNEPTVPRLWVRSNAEEDVLNEVKNGSPEDFGQGSPPRKTAKCNEADSP